MHFIEIEWQSELYRQEVELRLRLLRTPLGLAFSEQELVEESSQSHFAMMGDDQSLLACAVIVPLSEGRVKLRQMAVHEKAQGQGIGATLIRNIESVLRERRIETVELSARDTATGFYEKLGYVKQGDVFDEVTIPHWKMTKTI